MDENGTGGNKKKSTSPVRQRQRPNRAQYNSWASQRNRGGNSSSQQHNGASTSVNRQPHRNSENGILPTLNNSTDNDDSSAGSPRASNGYLSHSGLNGIRQLLDDIDHGAGSIPDDPFVTQDEDDAIPLASNANNSNTSRHSQSTAALNSRRGGRLRLRRTRPPANQSSGSIVGGAASNSSGTGPGRNTSPMRQSNQGRPHLPQMRFSSHAQYASPVDLSPSGFSPPDLPDFLRREPYNPISRGLGTEEEPYELSPGLPDVPTSPSAFVEPNTMMSDEEIALQLQQEEWEAASGFGDHDNHSHGAAMMNMFQYPNQRPRPSYLPPLRNRGEPFSSRHYGPNSGPSFRPPGRANRGRGGRPSMRAAMLRADSDLPPQLLGFAPMLIDLLGSYGISQDEFQNFHALLSPDSLEFLGQGDVGDYESLLALAEQLGEVSRGMPEADINRLPTSKHRSSPSKNSGATAAAGGGPELPQCNICLTDYENGDTKRLLPCKHDFHKDCVDQWLKTNATCPVCRSDVKPKRE